MHGPAAGASGGRDPFPTRLRAPAFLRFTQQELDALYNRSGGGLALGLYLVLCGGSVFKGPTAGEVLTTYGFLQGLLRAPKPERGQWAAPPSLKTVRTALAALESAGLVHRDAERNASQGQLRLYLTLRQAAKPTAKPPPVPRSAKATEARAKLAAVVDTMRTKKRA